MDSASTDRAAPPPIIVVMGVSGCGKSTVGQALAAALHLPYLEGDSFHPPENVARMAAGTPLTDEHRQGWLLTLSEQLALHAERGAVLGCSALKRSYRDVLRGGAPHLQLLHLHGSRELLAARMAARSGHYMPASLLDSQLATLEVPGPDERALRFDVAERCEDIVTKFLATTGGSHG
jgi:gluconokinase